MARKKLPGARETMRDLETTVRDTGEMVGMCAVYFLAVWDATPAADRSDVETWNTFKDLRRGAEVYRNSLRLLDETRQLEKEHKERMSGYSQDHKKNVG